MWISYMSTYIPSLLNLLPPPPHPTRLIHHSTELSSLQQLPTSYWFYTWSCTYVSVFLSIPTPTFSLPCCVHKSVLCDFISIPALQRGSSVPFSRSPYIWVNRQYFFFSDLTPLGASRSCFLPSRPSEESKIYPEAGETILDTISNLQEI